MYPYPVVMRSPWKKLLRRRVIVNLKTGDAIVGVLWEADKFLLTVVNASLHEHGTQEGKLIDGGAVVLLPDIKFIQILEG